MFNDQALFDAKVAQLEDARLNPEPEPAVEEPAPEPVVAVAPEPEPIPDPDPVEWKPPPKSECNNFVEDYGNGPSNGHCRDPLVSKCLKCCHLDRKLSLLTQDDVWGWSDWELREFLENMGFNVHQNEGMNTLQDKVRNILEMMRNVAKIASLQGKEP